MKENWRGIVLLFVVVIISIIMGSLFTLQALKLGILVCPK
jgi:hypothetical protein